MAKPRLLDLFCGAGGAAVGYHRAGFEVVGVDIKPQPHYPFEFHQAEALEYCAEYGREFDAIHASPPCQGYSRLRHLPWLKDKIYPLLINPVRDLLTGINKYWIIENVEDAPLIGMTLCGTMFGLPLFRHRKFETSFFMLQPPHIKHTVVLEHGHATMSKKYPGGVTGIFNGYDAGKAMDIDWMSKAELSQAVPPDYTEFIGEWLLSRMGEVDA